MPVMFVFQRMSGASGAGPDDERVKDESPWNCGHSYWSRSPYLEGALEVLVVLCPKLEKTAKSETNSSKAKTATVKTTFEVFILPPRRICCGRSNAASPFPHYNC
jgi:hypothetical protein